MRFPWEGAWHQESYQNNQELAKNLKRINKGEVTLEFAKAAADWVKSANQLINLIDVGGKISSENEMIMQAATHAVILAGDESKIPDWREFCHNLNLKVIAEIQSEYDAKEDKITSQEEWDGLLEEMVMNFPLLTGSVHYLERGEDVSTRPIVQALANLLVKLTYS